MPIRRCPIGTAGPVRRIFTGQDLVLRPDRVPHTYPRRRNANARHRDVVAAEHKERARIRSEKGIRRGGHRLAAVT